MRTRVSAKLSQTCRRCVQGDHTAGRVAQRCYGTVHTGTPATSTKTDTRNTSPFDVAAAVKSSDVATIQKTYTSNTLGERRRTTPLSATTTTPPRDDRQNRSPYHIPEVLISAEEAQSTSGPKIHILGSDARSTFIAHALSGVYDSVSMLSWKPNPNARYQSVQRARTDRRRGSQAPVEREIKQEAIGDDRAPIANLIIAGNDVPAVAGLQSVASQITRETNICVIHDGLGVLEDVRKQFMNDGIGGTPRLWGGYLSHKLVRNRKLVGTRELKAGVLDLYEHLSRQPIRLKDKAKVEWMTPGLFEPLSIVPELDVEISGYSDWIAKKLPSVVFDTVVEPVCAFFDIRYEEMQYNKPALTLMNQLLKELKTFCRVAPEMRAAQSQHFMGDNFVAAKAMLVQIGARRGMPCELSQRLKTGLKPGVEHTVQYFLRRGERLGVDMPRLEMMVHAVHAKQKLWHDEMESYIPMKEISLPIDMSFRGGINENTAQTLQELEKGRRRGTWRRSSA